MAKFCENCGAPLEDGARFCTSCGTEVKNVFLPNTTATEALRKAQENESNAAVGAAAAGAASAASETGTAANDGTLAHEAERFDHKEAEAERETVQRQAFERENPQRDSGGYVEEQGWKEQFFSISNRLNRKRYLIRIVQLWIITFLITLVATIILTDSMLSTFVTFFGLITTASSVSLGVRRCHDVGKSGWWMLILLVPVVNFLWSLFLFFKAGDQGANEYGPDPLGNQWR